MYMNFKNYLLALTALLASVSLADVSGRPSPTPGPGIRYATDAYPGFDSTDSFVRPEKKEPKWFHFWNGPKKDNPVDQLAYCITLIKDRNFDKAAKELDALVRDWPITKEAIKAQKALADIYLKYTFEYEKAVKEYVYLLDFYSFDHDYKLSAKRAYEAAERMREEGKTIVFFRFANTVDVRRSYEAIVLRSPGADFIPDALLTIAGLREDDEQYELALAVYENLRNLHPSTPQAKEAIQREARVRMKLLAMYEYNRERQRDTIDFLKLQITNPELSQEVRDEIIAFLNQSSELNEQEAYLAAKFYDKPSRTRRSAINAYESFLRKYPASKYAGEVLDRLHELERINSVKDDKDETL